jgi:hypothetical protein
LISFFVNRDFFHLVFHIGFVFHHLETLSHGYTPVDGQSHNHQPEEKQVKKKKKKRKKKRKHESFKLSSYQAIPSPTTPPTEKGTGCPGVSGGAVVLAERVEVEIPTLAVVVVRFDMLFFPLSPCSRRSSI